MKEKPDSILNINVVKPVNGNENGNKKRTVAINLEKEVRKTRQPIIEGKSRKEATVKSGNETRKTAQLKAEAENKKVSKVKTHEEVRKVVPEKAVSGLHQKEKANGLLSEEQRAKPAKVKANEVPKKNRMTNEKEESSRRIESTAQVEEQRKNIQIEKKNSSVIKKQECIDEPGKEITLITITHGESIIVYKKIVYSWGDEYYFKNGKSITEANFESETK